MTILNTLESTALDETIRSASKYFILTLIIQDPKLVNVKYVTYAQPILLSLKLVSLFRLRHEKLSSWISSIKHACLK